MPTSKQGFFFRFVTLFTRQKIMTFEYAPLFGYENIIFFLWYEELTNKCKITVQMFHLGLCSFVTCYKQTLILV